MVVAYILKFRPLIKQKSYNIGVVLFFVSLILSGQNKDIDSLRSKRKQFEKEIANANILLTQKGNTRKNYLSELEVIIAQIEAQNKVVVSYQDQIEVINQVIRRNKTAIDSLSSELQILRYSYHKLIMEANKQIGSNYNEFMIVFSAHTFSEAYRRFNLMKQYASYRKRQGMVLMDTKNQLDSTIHRNQLILEEKSKTYITLLGEMDKLKGSVVTKTKYVSDLKKDETWLRREIEKKQKASEELESIITNAISKAANEVDYAFSNFLSAKGNLIWPVAGGVVTSHFGEHNHAVLKGVKVNNNGIDITAAVESEVKCIYEGTVSRVIAIPGYNKAVIVRHGKFLSVYANLAIVNVKTGQVLKSNQSIGEIFASSDDKSGVLHFEIWEENKKTNPLDWLKK